MKNTRNSVTGSGGRSSARSFGGHLIDAGGNEPLDLFMQRVDALLKA
jgi:hypothetical protein